MSELVGELATRSDAFRTRWARHNVRLHRSTPKHIHNKIVGELELTGDALELPGDGLTLITYTAPAESHAQEQLAFLASWTTSRIHGENQTLLDMRPPAGNDPPGGEFRLMTPLWALRDSNPRPQPCEGCAKGL